MIRIDLRDFTAEREPVPAELVGLGSNTLRNLQTEGPKTFVEDTYPYYEWWPEIDTTPDYNPATTDVGPETFTVNQGDKTVSVERQLTQKPNVFDIVTTSVGGAGYRLGDTSKFYAVKLQAISVVISISKPDETFLVLPIMREDTGETANVFAQVLGGSATFDFEFPSSGNWIVTEELLNTTAQGDDIFTFAGISAVVSL